MAKTISGWSDVPEEFKWRAFDHLGQRIYFEKPPHLKEGVNNWLFDWQKTMNFGLQPSTHTNWRETLERRP